MLTNKIKETCNSIVKKLLVSAVVLLTAFYTYSVAKADIHVVIVEARAGIPAITERAEVILIDPITSAVIRGYTNNGQITFEGDFDGWDLEVVSQSFWGGVMYDITNGNVYAKVHSKALVPSVIDFQSYHVDRGLPGGTIFYHRRTGQPIQFYFSDAVDPWPQVEKDKILARMVSHEADLELDWYEEVYTIRDGDSESNFGINLYYDADGDMFIYGYANGVDMNDFFVKIMEITFNEGASDNVIDYYLLARANWWGTANPSCSVTRINQLCSEDIPYIRALDNDRQAYVEIITLDPTAQVIPLDAYVPQPVANTESSWGLIKQLFFE